MTDSDVGVHDRVCALFVGRKRKALKKFILETGIKFKVHTTDADHILVSGKDVEVVKKAVELITPHIDKIKREIQSKVYENVFTDEDEDIRYRICGLLIGKNGENIDRIRSDIGLNFPVLGTKDGHIRVSGTNAEVVKRAADRLTLEIKKIREDIEVFDQKLNS
ncbi:hypothetical protein CI610_03700 [invertebrate metagenome]|uniref:K Homology domain-containing protein n=1 Tax=invertebrate metagenome TaxID=1711999 RepID=A0A2H9T2E3_9ZZZZ